MPLTPPPLPPSQRPPGWWDRNWKWMIPVLILATVLVVGGCIVFVLGFMRSSDVYKDAIARVRNSSAVTSEIGTPLIDAVFFVGSINLGGNSGVANFEIPVHGPKGGATVSVLAHKTAGHWRFARLVVRIDGTDRRIDLSDK